MLFEDIELLIVLSEAKSLSQAADQLLHVTTGPIAENLQL